MLEKIVNDVIRKESRDEALEILRLAKDSEREMFIDYYKKDQENVCCLVLDTIKDRLVGENKMKHGGDFGDFIQKLY